MRKSIRIATAVGWVIAARVYAATPVPVTVCGQAVNGSGVLVGDLDCSGYAGDAVNLTGRLLLAGFTLTGNPAHDVVRCAARSCTVIGPGTVTGGLDGIRSDRGAQVKAGAVVSGNAGDGVRTDLGARVVDSTISGNGGDGVRAMTRALVVRSTVNANIGDGVRTDRTATVRASTVSGNGGNGIDSDASARAAAGSVVSSNGFDGVKGLRVLLSSSTATGNGTNPACGVVEECADLAAELGAVVRGTSTCGTSRRTEGGGTWGVCSLD